MLRKFCSIYH